MRTARAGYYGLRQTAVIHGIVNIRCLMGAALFAAGIDATLWSSRIW